MSLTTISDAEVTADPAQYQYVSIAYNEQMTSTAPTVSFTQDVLADGDTPTLTLDSNQTEWISNGSSGATYRFAYSLADNGVYYPHVGAVTGTGGPTDIAGNAPAQYSGTDDFAVNTATTPACVVDAWSNLKLVSEINVGEAQPRFYVRVDFDQPMAYWPKPVIGFSQDVSARWSTTTLTASGSTARPPRFGPVSTFRPRVRA